MESASLNGAQSHSGLEQNTTKPRFRLVTLQEVFDLPGPKWLIEGLIELEAFAVLYGLSGVAKSFLALDLLLHIAAGLPWHGRAVKQGTVVYVFGEGGAGIQKRIDAWLEEHKLTRADVPEAFFLPEPVQLHRVDEVADFLTAITLLPTKPVLIVFDTFARCFVGGDENSGKDMGLAIAGVGRIISSTNAAVLPVHHRGRAGDHERGHTSLRGAADAMILQTMGDKSGVITITNDKQKNAEECAPIMLRLKPVCLGTDQAGNPVTSCVLEATDALSVTEEVGIGEGLLKALEALASFSNGQSHPTAWYRAIDAQAGGNVPARTKQNWRKDLLKRALITAVGSDGSVKQYQITELGQRMLSASAKPVP
jgi:hypothetical protein